jgi:hypothetical protein
MEDRMISENYVEHVLTSLCQKPREDLQSHLNRLDTILEKVNQLPSPEKESLLVQLILTPWEESDEAQPLHSAP